MRNVKKRKNSTEMTCAIKLLLNVHIVVKGIPNAMLTIPQTVNIYSSIICTIVLYYFSYHHIFL